MITQTYVLLNWLKEKNKNNAGYTDLKYNTTVWASGIVQFPVTTGWQTICASISNAPSEHTSVRERWKYNEAVVI